MPFIMRWLSSILLVAVLSTYGEVPLMFHTPHQPHQKAGACGCRTEVCCCVSGGARDGFCSASRDTEAHQSRGGDLRGGLALVVCGDLEQVSTLPALKLVLAGENTAELLYAFQGHETAFDLCHLTPGDFRPSVFRPPWV